MHWTSHIVTGAAIGFLAGRRSPAFLLGAGSHALFDMIPHYDPESETAFIADSLLGVFILGWLALGGSARGVDPQASAFAGALGGALPDTELVVKLLTGIDNRRLLFPTHNGTLPHPQSGRTASSIIQAGITALLLSLSGLKLYLGKFRRG